MSFRLFYLPDLFYLFYHNSRTSKQNQELLGFVYVHIPYIPLKLQNEYTGHVSIFFYFLILYVLSSKNSPNRSTTFGPLGRKESISWVHTIWRCSLTAPWPKLPHGQLCATVVSTASITQCSSLLIIILWLEGHWEPRTRLGPKSRPIRIFH